MLTQPGKRLRGLTRPRKLAELFDIAGLCAARNVAGPGIARLRCCANYKALVGTALAAVSFKSKYIAVAVIAAVVLSLAVGSGLVLENGVQHA